MSFLEIPSKVDYDSTLLIEKEIGQPEIINTFKNNGQEIVVLTGKNPKCPAGFKIVKTNINEIESDTRVIVCAKNLQIPDKINIREISRPCQVGLDFADNTALAISNNEYESQRFAFGERDDAFTGQDANDEDFEYLNSHLSAEIWFIVLLFIIAMIYIINVQKTEKIGDILEETAATN